MTDILTPEDLMRLMLEAIATMDTSQEQLEQAGYEEGGAEEDFLKGLAQAYSDSLKESFATAKHRDAWVEGRVAHLKAAYTQTKNRTKALTHSVQNARQKVSAMQSMNKTRQEYAAFERVGPEGFSEAASKIGRS